MAVAKDVDNNICEEGDRVLVSPPNEPLLTGKISKIAPILERGNFFQGTVLEVDVKIRLQIPAGHTNFPMYKKFNQEKLTPQPSPLEVK
jgi:hypothetical protein